LLSGDRYTRAQHAGNDERNCGKLHDLLLNKILNWRDFILLAKDMHAER
jgi:hypothetical protein